MVLAGYEERRARVVNAGRARIAVFIQLLLGSLVLFGSFLVLLTGEYRYPVAVVAGAALGLVAIAGAIVVPWKRLPHLVAVGLVAIDIVLIALLRIGAPVSGFALLWVIPAIWAAWSFGLAGGVPTALAASLTYVAVNLADPVQPPNLTLLTFPLLLAGMTAISYVTARRADAQRDLLQRQSVALQHAAERARRQQELVTDVLDAVDFGVLRLDPDGALEFANEAYSRLQRSRDRSGETVYAADGVTPIPEPARPTARARRGETFDSELVWLGEPGEDRRSFSLSARRIRDARGSDVGAILVIQDVTAEQLALRAREDLVASVSHELRTPLTSVLGYLELALEDESLAPPTRRRLEIAQRGAERLLGLVADILATAVASRDGTTPTVAPVLIDLGEIVRAAVEAALPRALERQMTLDSTGVERAEAWADPHRIRQVVDNLLSNAIKYADEGGRIWVDCTGDGQQSWIAVRDDGPGISAEELPRLFDRYFRSDAVRKTATHGNGLGLAISQDIAQAHGGEIVARSSPGEGATFLVRLPSQNPKGDA